MTKASLYILFYILGLHVCVGQERHTDFVPLGGAVSTYWGEGGGGAVGLRVTVKLLQAILIATDAI